MRDARRGPRVLGQLVLVGGIVTAGFLGNIATTVLLADAPAAAGSTQEP